MRRLTDERKEFPQESQETEARTKDCFTCRHLHRYNQCVTGIINEVERKTHSLHSREGMGRKRPRTREGKN